MCKGIILNGESLYLLCCCYIIAGKLNVPITSELSASVDVKNTLPVKIADGELKIPLSTMYLDRVKTQPVDEPASPHDVKIGE